jgi:hypothetical protein
MMARINFLLLFFGTCLGCSSSANVQATAAAAVSDSFELMEARVEGDVLVLWVQYSGGSKVHDFELHSAGAPTKSLPRQVLLTVHHNAHGDRARAMIEEERTFDLTTYRDPRNNVVHLRMEGVDDVLVYRYSP